MNRPKILLVDDSKTVLLLMTTALRRVGYEVDTALEGNEALRKIASQRPHCLVLDIILPGINGYTVCRQIRARDPQHTLPILFISTKTSLFDHNYGLSLGADQYLAKPFTEEVFVQTVWNLLPLDLRAIQAFQPQRPDAKFVKLIPRHREDSTLLTTRNPFASNLRMDPATHQLYLAIDGRKTIKSLFETTGFDMQKLVDLLKILIEQQRVELYDPEERRVAVSLQDYL